MRDLDYLDLDGRLLRLLVTVVEEGSITAAARRLSVTQSAVSHQLDRLRGILDDPLFVKSGRGIVATARAEALAARARRVLDELRVLTTHEGFDPARLRLRVTVAANDLQRDLLLPGWLKTVRQQAPGLSLRVVSSSVPTAAMLRDAECELVISPRPPDAGDIMQKRLFGDRYAVFFDAGRRDAPANREEYLASRHVGVLYESRRRLEIDRRLDERGIRRDWAVLVPSFAGVRPFLVGSRRLATLPAMLARGALHGLATAPVPLETPPISMYLVWHRRHHRDPLHRWLREALEAVAAQLSRAA